MFLLSQFGKLACCPALLALMLAAGCSRPVGAANAHSDRPPAPFDDGNQPADRQRNAPDSYTGIPLHDSANLPAGTLITVHLSSPISADGPDTSGTFTAIVDGPVVVNGVTIVPRGVSASGRVESARASLLKRNRGYVRLSLDSITVSGRDLPVQTSSLFARGSAGDAQDSARGQSVNVIHLEKGRRLTFRLTGATAPVNDRTISSR